jgi:UDP-N-acetylglucosamine:LPS N-acetylglucosamine transferase
MGLPMVFSRIIPGQEEDNVEYLVNNEAGIKAVSAEEIVETASDLFNNPEKLAKMKANCIRVSKPNAAKDIVDFIVSKVEPKGNF